MHNHEYTYTHSPVHTHIFTPKTHSDIQTHTDTLSQPGMCTHTDTNSHTKTHILTYTHTGKASQAATGCTAGRAGI